MHTEIVFAKSPHVIDDGCDHSALIIWRMNANARACTRSAFVPAPVPVQVVAPKFDLNAYKGKAADKKKAKKEGFPAEKLVAIMLGNTLSHSSILAALDAQIPDHGLTRHVLQARITAMLKSPHCEITRHEKPVPEFTLTRVEPQFYLNSKRAAKVLR
ncbi:hypothetical protein [Serratia aquatilis]|uniref:Uncharacterized protein n=1 Tax=Serratia aquatilis TaxID=1737515 RepID=A0ABV6EEL0_9GAMM